MGATLYRLAAIKEEAPIGWMGMTEGPIGASQCHWCSIAWQVGPKHDSFRIVAAPKPREKFKRLAPKD
jgi:hypothetical protein